MRAALLKAALIAAWIMIAIELAIFGLGLLSIAIGETVVGGGPTGLLAQCSGMLRVALHGVVPPMILLIVIRIYQARTS